MRIRMFRGTDTNEMVTLFYDTVHTVNERDYTVEQLHVWAPEAKKNDNVISWKHSLARNITYIAEIKDKIVGFGDVTHDGYLDRLYTHKDYQGQGIATALVNKLESEIIRIGIATIDTEASMTAKAFFEHRGYKTIAAQTVQRQGITLQNFKMRKRLLF